MYILAVLHPEDEGCSCPAEMLEEKGRGIELGQSPSALGLLLWGPLAARQVSAATQGATFPPGRPTASQTHTRCPHWREQHLPASLPPLPGKGGNGTTGGVSARAVCLLQAGACFQDKSQQVGLGFLLMPFCRSRFAFPKAFRVLDMWRRGAL